MERFSGTFFFIESAIVKVREIREMLGCNNLNLVDIFEYENGVPCWMKI
jgi:hypothetical protein